MVYKYFLKTFYNKTSKKEYKSQIWQNNVQYTNIILIKDIIILEKAWEKKLLEDPTDITALAKVV